MSRTNASAVPANVSTKIQSLAHATPQNAAIWEWLSSLSRNRTETTIDRVLVVAPLATRKEVVSFFRELQRIGVGVFVSGRRGHPSRFRWAMKLTDAVAPPRNKRTQRVA